MADAYSVSFFYSYGGISITPGGYEYIGNPDYSLPVILAVTAIIVLILAAVIFSVGYNKKGKTSIFVLAIFSTLAALFIYFLPCVASANSVFIYRHEWTCFVLYFKESRCELSRTVPLSPLSYSTFSNFVSPVASFIIPSFT